MIIVLECSILPLRGRVGAKLRGRVTAPKYRHPPSSSRRGERLSLLSSALPWLFVPDDGVEDGEEFAHGCDDGDDFWFSGRDETVAEGLEGRIVTGCHQRRHEQDGPHLAASAADETPAAPFS